MVKGKTCKDYRYILIKLHNPIIWSFWQMVTKVLLITITVVVVPIALSANFRPGWWDHDSFRVRGLLNGALSDNEWKYYYVAWKKKTDRKGARLNKYRRTWDSNEVTITTLWKLCLIKNQIRNLTKIKNHRGSRMSDLIVTKGLDQAPLRR